MGPVPVSLLMMGARMGAVRVESIAVGGRRQVLAFAHVLCCACGLADRAGDARSLEKACSIRAGAGLDYITSVGSCSLRYCVVRS